MGFRDELRAGLFPVSKTTPKNSIHKFKGNYVLDENGYCDHEFAPEGNYFLLKLGRITNGYYNRKR